MSLSHWGNELYEGDFISRHVINRLILWKCRNVSVGKKIDVLISGRYEFNTRRFLEKFTLLYNECIPSPFHIKVYNARACSKTKTIGSAQYRPR